MQHASLFSGIGGFDLAAQWMGWENVFHCEWNEFGQKILKHHWPNAISYGDITKTDFSIHRGTIDVLTGGFPCQPFSLAGLKKGTEDDRHLWPEMLRAIREIQPGWVVGENVYGIINWNGGLVFDEVQTNLEAEGYEVWPYVLPACSVNASHRRDRIWFVAHSNEIRLRTIKKKVQVEPLHKWSAGGGAEQGNISIPLSWPIAETINRDDRIDDGLPYAVDRLGALGNAIAPHVALQIFKAIKMYSDAVKKR